LGERRRAVAPKAPAVRLACRVCFRDLPETGDLGRPLETCAGPCRKIWGVARRRAGRARGIALRHLDQAMLALGGTKAGGHLRQVKVAFQTLEAATPAELAGVLPRDLVGFDPADLPGGGSNSPEVPEVVGNGPEAGRD
jgi:hypothetical protein